MFTGIVTAVGTIQKAERSRDGLTLRIGAPYRGLKKGESIAVDGACLTVERSGKGWFQVHVVSTSIERTLFGEFAKSRKVNLERALKAGDRLGGHIVQGHVDGVGEVLSTTTHGDAWLIDIAVPAEIARVSVPLGSITVAGVSLTVNAIPRAGVIQVSLIPFTFQHTTLGTLVTGDSVHLESDTIGKYVDALLAARTAPARGT